jgi:hypothetical protein
MVTGTLSARGVRDLVIQMTGLVVAAKLAQRCLVQVKKNVAQLVGWGIAGGKTLPVNLAQCADRRGAVLVADFAIVVALAIVETCLTHAALPCACVETSSHPGEMAIVHRNRGLSGFVQAHYDRRGLEDLE